MIESKHQTSFYADFQAMAHLKADAIKDQGAALDKTAKQFESIFISMMLKSMRNANEAFKDDSLFSSDSVNFYEGMFDQQLSVDLSEEGGLGLSKVITEQLSPHQTSLTSVDVLKSHTISPHAIDKQKSIMDPKFNDPEQFIGSVYPIIKKHAEKYGVDPKIVLSQAILETGWGKSIIQHGADKSSHNLFNIKSKDDWHGDSVYKNTIEYNQGTSGVFREKFKSYKSYDESVQDYFKLIHESPRYAQAIKNKEKPQAFIQSLHEAGYATDPKYSQKIMSVYQNEKLHQL